jgi:hypothetical protein
MEDEDEDKLKLLTNNQQHILPTGTKQERTSTPGIQFHDLELLTFRPGFHFTKLCLLHDLLPSLRIRSAARALQLAFHCIPAHWHPGLARVPCSCIPPL